MNVSAWSIRNPTPAILLFIMLTLVGLLGFQSMKIQNFPDIDLPTINIVASLPGASPAQMETEVARKIENSVATLQNVKHIYTKVQDGTATITVEFRLEKSTQDALDDVRDAVARVRSDLPGDMRDPVITKMELAGLPILTYTVASTRMDDEALSWFVDNTITKTMLGVRGVGAVGRVGGVNREVRVELDPLRLQALNATAADISRQLRAVQQEASGGRTDVGGSEQSVRTIATVRSAEELARMSIVLSDGRNIRLDQVADVRDTVAEVRSAALLNGERVVGFEITRSRGAGEVEVAEGVRAALDKLRAEHPDITVVEAFNFVDPVLEGFDGSMLLMYEGAALAVLVVLLFLRDWRATLVAATALPMSVIPAFGVMYFFGFSLNVVTLLSLSLVVGILVDDAIVEIENIMRHLRMGKSPYKAAMEAADEIGLAVIATTFTLDRGVPAHRLHGRRAGQVLRAVRLDGSGGGVLLAGGGAHADADDGRLPAAPAEEGAQGAGLAQHLHALGGVVPEAPHPDDAGSAVLPGRLVCAGAAAADRLHSARRPVADAGEPVAATGQHLRADLRRGRTRARAGDPEPARQAGLHGHRRRQRRRRPVRTGRRRRGAHRHADHQHDPARRARRPQQAGHRIGVAPIPRSAARCAGQGRLRRLVGEIHPGAGRRGRPRAARTCARGRTRPAQHPRHRQRHLHVEPGAPGADRAPGLRARRRSGRHLGGDRRHLAHRHRRRLRPEPGQAEPVAAPGAGGGEAEGRCAHRHRAAVAAGGAGCARAGDAGQRRRPEHRKRPGADRPLRPRAQHQLRDRVEPAAAGRGGTHRAEQAEPEEPAAGCVADHGG